MPSISILLARSECIAIISATINIMWLWLLQLRSTIYYARQVTCIFHIKYHSHRIVYTKIPENTLFIFSFCLIFLFFVYKKNTPSHTRHSCLNATAKPIETWYISMKCKCYSNIIPQIHIFPSAFSFIPQQTKNAKLNQCYMIPSKSVLVHSVNAICVMDLRWVMFKRHKMRTNPPHEQILHRKLVLAEIKASC